MPRNISVFFLLNRFLLITCSGLATAKYQILQRIKIPTKLNRFPTSIVVVVSKVLETNNHVVQVYLSSIFYEFQQQFNLVSINEWLSTALIIWPYDAAPDPCCFHQFLSSCFQFKNVYFRIVLSRLGCVNSVPVIDVFSDLLWFYLNNFILWFFLLNVWNAIKDRSNHANINHYWQTIQFSIISTIHFCFPIWKWTR